MTDEARFETRRKNWRMLVFAACGCSPSFLQCLTDNINQYAALHPAIRSPPSTSTPYLIAE
ncbi:hypothetical protein BDN67DRAFT_1018126 [Paxillus ammoniavirescens]|nr:hypothetical protein BDN67DRAFT_1018126 [Paxillus ammoniavirescens]